MANKTRQYNKAKERTFKDDVLSLVNDGNDNDFFDYYVVSMSMPCNYGTSSYIEDLQVSEKSILLQRCTDGAKTIIPSDNIYRYLSSIRQEKQRIHMQYYPLNNPRYRRKFIANYFLNLSDQDFTPQTILFKQSVYLNHRCAVYFPYSKEAKKDIDKRMKAFKRVYERTIRYHRHAKFPYISFLFYSIFFNTYSDIGLIDNYCSWVAINNDTIGILPIYISNMSEKTIKSIIIKLSKGNNPLLSL